MKAFNEAQQRFVLHWGEMGSRWGINRTMGQIQALLYLSPEPLHAEAISEALNVARSNVSNSLRELQGWKIVRLVHRVGDKRDHFESQKDPWDLFRQILEERKRREVDPTLELLNECLKDLDGDKEADPYTKKRLREMQDFFVVTTGWYDAVSRWPNETLKQFLKLGNKSLRLLGIGRQ